MENHKEQNFISKSIKSTFVSSFIIPLILVVIGALVFWLVAKIITAEKSPNEYVSELESKTFGNKWVSAYELSKILSRNNLSPSEKEELSQKLVSIYRVESDQRTKHFLISSLSFLKLKSAIPVIHEALNDEDGQIRFSAIKGIAEYSREDLLAVDPENKILEDLLAKLKTYNNGGGVDAVDKLEAQAIVLCLGTQVYPPASDEIVKLLAKDDLHLRWTAALSLLNFQNEQAIKTLSEILLMGPESAAKLGVLSDELSNLKINIVERIGFSKWNILNNELNELLKDPKTPPSLTNVVRETLKMLKK